MVSCLNFIFVLFVKVWVNGKYWNYYSSFIKFLQFHIRFQRKRNPLPLRATWKVYLELSRWKCLKKDLVFILFVHMRHLVPVLNDHSWKIKPVFAILNQFACPKYWSSSCIKLGMLANEQNNKSIEKAKFVSWH